MDGNEAFAERNIDERNSSKGNRGYLGILLMKNNLKTSRKAGGEMKLPIRARYLLETHAFNGFFKNFCQVKPVMRKMFASCFY